MEQHSASMRSDCTNVSLNHTILPVSTDATERLRLRLVLTVFDKRLAVEDLVVAVNMLDTTIVPFLKSFKRSLGFKSSSCASGFLEVSPEEFCEMIDP